MLETQIIDVLNAHDHVEPNDRVTRVCDDIKSRHENRVLAFVYYGSSLREMNNPEKMLDFYVIVDSYRKTHKNPIRIVLNAMIPPAVYYHEMRHPDNTLTTCKYSIVSIKAFERRSSSSALLSTVWGRFSQPCVLLFAKDEAIHERLMRARATAVQHIAKQTLPLFEKPADTQTFWARAFRESYRTELRPESSESRSKEIVARYQERYDALMVAFFGNSQNGVYKLPVSSGSKQMMCRFKWFLRRLLGKPMTAIRLVNNGATFDGGLDYVLRKLKNHSGVTLDPTPAQRKHPILWSPVLGWKLWRKGAFK